MQKILKNDIRVLVNMVNSNIPQNPSDPSCKRQIKIDYCSQYGGWAFYYINGSGQTKMMSAYRLPTREAHAFLQGILFTLEAYKKEAKENSSSLNQ